MIAQTDPSRVGFLLKIKSLTNCRHSKGAQEQKRSVDRASGSGVSTRAPDAQLDVLQMDHTQEQLGLARQAGGSRRTMTDRLKENAAVTASWARR